MLSFKGLASCSLIAMGTSLLNTWKLVITIGGSNGIGFILSGKNWLNPLVPPKYIIPEVLLQNACTLNSLDCNPSDSSKFLNTLVARLNREIPLLVLIQRFPLSSSSIPKITSLGSPSAVVKLVNRPFFLSRQLRPDIVPIHIFLFRSSQMLPKLSLLILLFLLSCKK